MVAASGEAQQPAYGLCGEELAASQGPPDVEEPSHIGCARNPGSVHGPDRGAYDEVWANSRLGER